MSRVVYELEKRITQKFGNNGHRGCDIGWRTSESQNNVYALTTGTVEKVVDGKNLDRNTKGNATYGNYVVIKHANGLKSLYAHLLKNSIKVKVGESVTKDSLIGIMGDSGNTYGRHLHLEITLNGKLVNPLDYVNKDLESEAKPDVIYQAYDNVLKKWWSETKNYNNTNTNGYAGFIGHSLGGLRVKLSNGAKITIKSHILNGNWLSEISKWDGTSNGYSGLYGKPIDKIMIKSEIPIKYRVCVKENGWLDWVTGYNEKDPLNGYAGLTGEEINLIQITVI